PERPDYRTETDSQGAFAFSYLTEQPYYVIALADQNRNRRPDPQERFAAPPRPVVLADTSAGAPLQWIATVLDTIPPEPQRVRALSRDRLVVRFSEPVRLADRSPGRWGLRDSLRDASVPVQAVYTLPETPQEVYLRTDVLRAEPHLLRAAAVVDTSGNLAADDPLRFTPTASADTLRTRFLGFMPDTLGPNEAGAYRLLPRQQPGVRFNQPVGDALLQQAVAVRDTAGAALPFTARTSDGTAYRLLLEPPLAPGQTVEVAVAGNALGTADTVYTRRYERLPETALGARSGTVLLEGDGGTIVVELYPADRPDAPYRQRLESSNQYLFEGLPEGRYRLRAFLDRDADTLWDGGLLAPYRAPEPVVWGSDSLTVRPRWELTAADTLLIPAR
ncbi:MAG: hypothetical protein R3362_12335, partial [Rhodothermales bacterium]|nr:hypothetical protein [Rhodothermales bacterium]